MTDTWPRRGAVGLLLDAWPTCRLSAMISLHAGISWR